jgi:hypothetical protein
MYYDDKSFIKKLRKVLAKIGMTILLILTAGYALYMIWWGISGSLDLIASSDLNLKAMGYMILAFLFFLSLFVTIFAAVQLAKK